jgi:hypothetical protein
MSISPASPRIAPQQVSAAIRQAAGNDGDGKTGAAALNDGDAAAHAAALQVAHRSAPSAGVTPTAARGSQVDVKVR